MQLSFVFRREICGDTYVLRNAHTQILWPDNVGPQHDSFFLLFRRRKLARVIPSKSLIILGISLKYRPDVTIDSI